MLESFLGQARCYALNTENKLETLVVPYKMETQTSLLEILSMTGTLLSVLACLSPLPAVYKAYSTQKMEGVDVEYMFLSKVTNFAWLIYEVSSGEYGAIPSSILAYILFMMYLAMCARVTGDLMISITQQLSTEALLLIGIKQFLDLDSLVLLTFVLTFACYITPVIGLVSIVKEKNIQMIDLNIAGAILLSNGVWTVYFSIKKNSLLAWASMLGVIFGGLMLGAYCWIKSTKVEKVSRFVV